MVLLQTKSPYLGKGRLADVLAALQVMGAGQRPEGEIRKWAKELSYSETSVEIARWEAVFKEHPEFFLVYKLDGSDTLKAALRWRYTNKLYDSKSGKEYTQIEKDQLPEKERWLLTTKPLTSDAIAALMSTAIELHNRAIAEQKERRWLVPPLVAFLGALLGAVLGGHK